MSSVEPNFVQQVAAFQARSLAGVSKIILRWRLVSRCRNFTLMGASSGAFARSQRDVQEIRRHLPGVPRCTHSSAPLAPVPLITLSRATVPGDVVAKPLLFGMGWLIFLAAKGGCRPHDPCRVVSPPVAIKPWGVRVRACLMRYCAPQPSSSCLGPGRTSTICKASLSPAHGSRGMTRTHLFSRYVLLLSVVRLMLPTASSEGCVRFNHESRHRPIVDA